MTDVGELLSAGVNAVSIAVPTTRHRAMAEPLLEAGVACLIEKPLAQNVEDAWALKEVAERTGSVLMVGHIECFNPIMRAFHGAHTRQVSGLARVSRTFATEVLVSVTDRLVVTLHAEIE